MSNNVSIATVARTAALGLALANQLLSAAGKPILPAGLTIAAAIPAWWKNNSFTPEALEGDRAMNAAKRRVH